MSGEGFTSRVRPPIGGSVVVSVVFGFGDAAVSFPTGYFSAAPIVVASMDGANFDWIAATGSITSSGFTMTVAQRDGTSGAGTVTTRWIAVAP